jgi:hypothetical protein
VETLKAELIASHEEAERNSKELGTIRSQVLNENAQESLLLERELRETLSELERCRLERGEWERTSMQEKMLGDEARLNLETLRRDLEMEREARDRESVELAAARETAANLQSVLEDFQACKSYCVNFNSNLAWLNIGSQGPRTFTSCEGLQISTR